MADVDEALVEEVAAVLSQANPKAWPVAPELARAVLAHLAPRLIPAAATERVEWSSRTPADPEPTSDLGEKFARHRTRVWVEKHGRPATTVKRTVTTITGPWTEVEG